MNDQRQYRLLLEGSERTLLTKEEGARRWQVEVLEPTLARLRPVIGSARDPLQAYCDVLEMKWLLSERAGTDVGLATAIEAYLAAGAPGPEVGVAPMGALDVET
jgi:hypothetical protein